MSKKDIVQKKPLFQRFLDSVERTGNKLPHPATLFAIFALATVVFSHLAYLLNTSVTVPNLDPDSAADDLVIAAKSLLTREGVRHIFMSTVGSFVGFAPLGIVLVAMLGVGVAEHVGLLTALIKKMILGKSKSMITIMIIFVGLFSNVASEVGYLVVIPLGAAIFYAVGRHPLAGLAAAFFGVSGGFAANVVLSVNDLLLTGITQEAAQLYKPGITVLPTCNYYFMVASTILLVTVGYFVTEKIIVPKLGEYKPEKEVAGGDVSANLTDIERRGLRYAGLALLAAIALLVLLIAPEWAPLRGAETNDILGRDSPIMRGGLVTIIMLVFVVPALAYGIGVKTIKSDKDVITAMSKTMQTMGGYLVLVFFAAQFINYFNYSELGRILSVNGANFLEAIGFKGIPLILSFILLSAFLNIFMGSSAAKWVLMAPIFVPMFMQLGYDPAFTQVAYRIGESVTNVITPLMAYFALIVVFAEKYVNRIGIGTIISLMLPYTIIALISWSILLVIWYLIGLPLGIGGYIYL